MARLLLALTVALQLAAGPSMAADLGARAPVTAAPTTVTPEDADAGMLEYLQNQAVLLMIRASFDVLPLEAVATELAAETRRLGADGPSDFDQARQDQDLLAEGSYYLVSMRYLAETGGAIWPDDRPERFYLDDARVKLDSLQTQLVDAVAAGTDTLGILQQAQDLLALTYGLKSVSKEMDRFSGRDALVEGVLAQFGPRAST